MIQLNFWSIIRICFANFGKNKKMFSGVITKLFITQKNPLQKLIKW